MYPQDDKQYNGKRRPWTRHLLDDSIHAWRFPTTGTCLERTDQALAELEWFREMTDILDDPEVPFTEKQAVKLFRRHAPNVFKLDRACYEKITTMADLDARARLDATRYDSESTSSDTDPGLRVMAAVTGRRIDSITSADLRAFELDPRSFMGRKALLSHGDRDRSDRPPRKGREKPRSGEKWCSHHKSQHHSDAECWFQHPELHPDFKEPAADRHRGASRDGHTKPTTPRSESGKGKATKLYKVSSDGKLVCVNPGGQQYVPGKAMMTITTTEFATALAAGATTDVDASRCIFIDNCADESFANSLVGLTDVVEIPETDRLPFNGIGSDAVVPTHRATRWVPVSAGCGYHEPVNVVIGGPFNITCTSAMASAGFSTTTDASLDGQLFIEHDDQRVAATRVGNIYAVPLSCQPPSTSRVAAAVCHGTGDVPDLVTAATSALAPSAPTIRMSVHSALVASIHQHSDVVNSVSTIADRIMECDFSDADITLYDLAAPCTPNEVAALQFIVQTSTASC